MHQLPGYTLKVSFIVLLGRCSTTVHAYTHLCDQRQFEPRIRDHSLVTRSIFEIPSPSGSAKVHSRVAHCRYDYFSFSFQGFFLKCAYASTARALIGEISRRISYSVTRARTGSEIYACFANLTIMTNSTNRFVRLLYFLSLHDTFKVI